MRFVVSNSKILLALVSSTMMLTGCGDDGGSTPSSVVVDGSLPGIMQSGQASQGSVGLSSTIVSLTSVDSEDVRQVTILDSSSCSPKLSFNPSVLNVVVDGAAQDFLITAPPGHCEHVVSFSGPGITTSTSTSDINVVTAEVVVAVGLFDDDGIETDIVTQGGTITIKFTQPQDWQGVTTEQSYIVSTVTAGISFNKNTCTMNPLTMNSCEIIASIDDSVAEGVYSFAIAQSSGTEIPVDDESLSFTVNSLGLFAYKNSDGDVITELSLIIDAAAETITLVNLGATTITSIQTNTDGADLGKFTLSNDSCNNQSLATDATCTFDIALSDQAVADQTYTFSTTGTNASNSPVNLAVTAVAPSCKLTVGYYQWPRDANLGILANAAGVAGVNASGGMSFSTAEGVFLTWLNAQNYCGYNDWEIPTVNQYGCTNGSAGECNTLALGGLLVDWDSNSQTASTYLISLGFMNLEASQYWSSTYSYTNGSGVIFNWLLYLTQANNGFIANWNGINNSFPALPVRGTKAYITNEELDQVTKCYVTPTGTFINCEQTGANFDKPNAITFNSEENIAYVVNEDGSSVIKCDVDESRNLDNCASTGNNFTSPNAIALYNSGTIAYVNNSNKSVTKCEVNAVTGEFANCIAMADVAGVASYTMAVNNQENIAYIPGYNGGMVTKCSINQVTFVFDNCSETGSGLSSSRGIVISTSLDMVFITNLHGDKVFKCSIEVDGDLGACTDTGATLATSPAGIALSEDESMAFISNVFDNTVTVCNVNESGSFTGCINTGTTDVDGPNGLYITQ